MVYGANMSEHTIIPLISSPCPYCGGKGELAEGCYAGDNEFVFCESCGAETDSYAMGMYNEGTIRAIEDWNSGKITKA